MKKVCHSDRSVSGVEESSQVAINNLRKVKLATWVDPSTPFHFGRDDMSGGGAIHPHGLFLLRCLAMNHRRYIGCTVVRSGCSGGNLPPSGPGGPESLYI